MLICQGFFSWRINFRLSHRTHAESDELHSLSPVGFPIEGFQVYNKNYIIQGEAKKVKTVILACNTLRDELQKAAHECGCDSPFIWIESGLHLEPASLRRRIQEELDRIPGPRRVLLGFGFCGNAVLGLKSGEHELVIPKVDDCITWLLGSKENRERSTKDGGVYFLTKGWLEGEANIWQEYKIILERYGKERTDRVYKRMLAHYRFLGLIDTHAYDLGSLLPQVEEIASTLHLELKLLPGVDHYLKKFLIGPWDDSDFVIAPPSTTIELHHLGCTPDSCLPYVQGVR
jgi:hypothetical protein